MEQHSDRRREDRLHMRLDKVFPVVVCSEIFGDGAGIARNISMGGMLVEMFEPLPLGSCVTVRFAMADCSGEIAVQAEVKHHYCFNFAQGNELSSSRGIGLRFVAFIEDSADRLQDTFRRQRVLH